MDNFTMDVGQVIKVLRLHRKMTQEQIGLEADIATSNVSRIEKGLRQPSQKVLIRIAKALNTKPSFIYAACEHPLSNIPMLLQEEDNKATPPNHDEFVIHNQLEIMLNFFSELTPENKALLIAHAKTLHMWQSKYSA